MSDVVITATPDNPDPEPEVLTALDRMSETLTRTGHRDWLIQIHLDHAQTLTARPVRNGNEP